MPIIIYLRFLYLFMFSFTKSILNIFSILYSVYLINNICLHIIRPDPQQSSSMSATKPVLIDLPDGQSVDPFTTEFQELLLGQVQPPVHERHGYVQCQGPLPLVCFFISPIHFFFLQLLCKQK